VLTIGAYSPPFAPRTGQKVSETYLSRNEGIPEVVGASSEPRHKRSGILPSLSGVPPLPYELKPGRCVDRIVCLERIDTTGGSYGLGNEGGLVFRPLPLAQRQACPEACAV
jgi:hypothetical protein